MSAGPITGGVVAARATPAVAGAGVARRLLPGLLLAGGIALAAHLLARQLFPYALAVGFEVPLAMLLGLVVVNVGGAPAWAVPGIRFAAKHVLALGIVLLGLRLNLHAIAAIGADAILLVTGTIAATCAFAMYAGRKLGVERRVVVLIGVGTSVCGNSAIIAAAPVVKADEREISFAVATITVFGTLAVFVFPLIGHALDLDVLTFGMWSGTAVPDTAQTIASSGAYSTTGRDVATVVKLVRNVLMAPLVILLAWAWARYGHDARGAAESTRRSVRRAFPYFLIGFLALSLVRTSGVVDVETLSDADVLTRACFIAALAGLGLQTRLSQLRSVGARPFVLGFGTTSLLAAGSLAVILGLGLGPSRTPVAGGVEARPWYPDPTAVTASPVRLQARVIATGIPGAGALSPVGRFHPGGPIHDLPRFAALTRRGKVLDPGRLLVASTSNFGAPLARRDWAAGSILSLATDARGVVQPPAAFAASGGQASALGGAVQLYSAQSPAFINRPEARTADLPAVSNPQGISVNNAFGRPWFANAPGRRAPGVETVVDPDGRPLEDAPSKVAGGVFAGSLTDRDRQLRKGSLAAGAVANALLGASPDATGRAVFAVATADGALAQVHVEEGVDGLAPPGTIAPPLGRRVGMVFNWVPDRFLYVSDSRGDAIVQLRLDDDFRIFRVAETRRLRSPHISEPVDLAPAVPEIANPAFSSNTTLAGGSDLYVANRGTGTIVRLRQDGRIRAVARVVLPGNRLLPPGVLNGIAVAPDADRIWLSFSGSVVEIPAFGAPR